MKQDKRKVASGLQPIGDKDKKHNLILSMDAAFVKMPREVDL